MREFGVVEALGTCDLREMEHSNSATYLPVKDSEEFKVPNQVSQLVTRKSVPKESRTYNLTFHAETLPQPNLSLD